MTQSGVSQHISKLEQQLDVALLHREGKQFTLSEAGLKLYEGAQTVLQELANLEQSTVEDSPYAGEVKVMSPGSVGLKLYPQLLLTQAQYPDLVIDYRFAPNTQVELSIANSEADIGLMTIKPTLPDVSCEEIGSEPLVLVTPENIETPSFDVLMGLGFVDHPDGRHHADLLLSANYPEFQHSDLFPKRGFSNQIGLILEPVSLGLGFTVLPANAVKAFHQPGMIRGHLLSHSVCETLYLCKRRNRRLPKRVESISSRIQNHIAKTEGMVIND